MVLQPCCAPAQPNSPSQSRKQIGQNRRQGQQGCQQGDESGIVFRQRSRHARVARPQRRVVERLDQDVARPQVRRQLAGIVRREVGEEEIGS